LINNVDYSSSFKDLGIGASMLGYVTTNRGSDIRDINTKTILEADISDE
jgi:hypothetical protein